MDFYKNIRIKNWAGYVIALGVAIAIILYTNKKVEELKVEESIKVKNYANTLEILNTEINLPPKTQLFLVDVVEQNRSIPVILIDESGSYIDSKNVKKEIISNPNRLKKELDKMSDLHQPIAIDLPFGKQYVYYKNSMLLNQLQYYPIILFIVILFFIWFSYWYFKIIRETEQSMLWAGMAKETAHQIGTPLSSIIGWIEILKLEEIDPKPIQNIERDISRLQNISDRFSKIGSTPSLEEGDIVDVTQQAFLYLRNRASKQVNFIIEVPDYPILIQLNTTLFSWVIENLIKNAIDSMRKGGDITLSLKENGKNVVIDITDQGGGILSKDIQKIFKPGFTTKKRGWGLGLSLAKRIVEDYHKGRIFVLNSESNKGTTFRIIFKK